MESEGCKSCLVGTFALAIQGINVGWSDVDFLCKSVPKFENTPERYNLVIPAEDNHYQVGAESREIWIDHIEINLIYADVTRIQYWPSNPLIIDGVLVSPAKEMLQLKKAADRAKDRQFFEAYPDLLKYL